MTVLNVVGNYGLQCSVSREKIRFRYGVQAKLPSVTTIILDQKKKRSRETQQDSGQIKEDATSKQITVKVRQDPIEPLIFTDDYEKVSGPCRMTIYPFYRDHFLT